MNEYERCLHIWRNWVRSAPQEIEERLPHYQAMQTYHSVKLEYPGLNFTQAKQVWDGARLTAYTGELYPAIAVSNHRVAYRLKEACLHDKEPLSVELICGFQHALSCGLYTPEAYVDHEDRPGDFKQADQVSGVIDVGASPEETEQALNELVNEMPRITDMNDTLVAAAYLHARIRFLRPFAVANGITSRFVTNYWLRLQGYPPVLIQSTDAVAYQKCLEAFDVREDIEPLALFMCEQIAGFWGGQMSAKDEARTKPLFTLHL